MNKTAARIITSLMVMVALFSSCKKGPPIQYEDEDNFTVEPVAYNEVRIVEYLDYTERPVINIPPRIQNKFVTEIGQNSVAGRWFFTATIPDTVVNIMDFAFADNLIQEIHFPKKLTEIGAGAFMINRLTNIVIPGSVKKIGYRAFFENPLKSITIGGDVELGELSGYDTEKQESWKYTAFEDTGFDEAYRENGRQAGTYTKIDDIWQFALPGKNK
jgi:hypothetical protein